MKKSLATGAIQAAILCVMCWITGSPAQAVEQGETLFAEGFDQAGPLDANTWTATNGGLPSCQDGQALNSPQKMWNSVKTFADPVSIEFSGVYLMQMPRSGGNGLSLAPGGWGNDMVTWAFDSTLRPWFTLVPLRSAGGVDGWGEGYDNFVDLAALPDITKKENAINLRIDWWPGKTVRYYLNGKFVVEFTTKVPSMPLPAGVRDESVGFRIGGIKVTRLSRSPEETPATPPPPVVPVAVTRPMEWQVAQRDDQQMATIPVGGMCTVAGDRAEARLVLMPGASGRETEWTKMTAEALPGKFSGEIHALAGGWYELQVRVMRGDAVAAEAKLPHIGVGEVFIIAGQSNSANHGDTRFKAAEDRAVSYGKGRWQPAADPMPGATGIGGSCWCPFADLLVRSLDVPVGIVSVGVTATPMRLWLPEGNCYPRLRQALEDMRPNGVRAVLWHQGEADHGVTASDVYYNGMKRIIEATAKDAGRPVQWFVAQVSYSPLKYDPPPVLWQPVRDAQERLWKDGIALQGPDTDDLVGPNYRCMDEIHMGKAGLIAHGQRWFAAVWSRIFAQQPFPRAQAAIAGTLPEADMK